jgi:hypothetical protein
MLIEWIATIALGFGAAGVVMILRRFSGGSIPRFAIPAAAGAAMIGFAIWSEYSWFSRTTAALPPGVVITGSHSVSSGFRPWSYIVPFVNRFSAVDRASIRRNERAPGQVMIDLLLVTRNAPAANLPLLVDCTGKRRANIVDGVTFDSDGVPVGAEWHPLESGDPLIDAVCGAT